MRKLIPWALAFASSLLSARAYSAGQIDGRPNPAAMWPPHRRPGTPPTHKMNPGYMTVREHYDDFGNYYPEGFMVRRRAGKRPDRFRMAVENGRVTVASIEKLVGGKGLRP
jgi:hypothetical protein